MILSNPRRIKLYNLEMRIITNYELLTSAVSIMPLVNSFYFELALSHTSLQFLHLKTYLYICVLFLLVGW